MHPREQIEEGEPVASERQQAKRALGRLMRKHPLAALLLAAVLAVSVACGWIEASGSGAADTAGPAADQAVRTDSAASSDEAIQQAEIVRVVDGDTLKVKIPGNDNATVRLVGMDTPESVAPDASRNCREGVIASDYAKSLVSPGQTVWLSRDASDTDKYGRLLRYVWLEQPDDPSDEGEIARKMLNAILVRDGYAQAKRYKPDTTLYDLFKRWGDEAAEEGRGVTHKWA